VLPWFVRVGDVGERAAERHVRMDEKRSLLCVSLFSSGNGSFSPWRRQSACLCGVPMYASAQSLDFLVKAKNPRFRIEVACMALILFWLHVCHSCCPLSCQISNHNPWHLCDGMCKAPELIAARQILPI